MRERFDKFVEWYGDMVDRGDKDCFDINDFEKYKWFVLDWRVVKRCVEEENNDGVSYGWDDVKFVEGV